MAELLAMAGMAGAGAGASAGAAGAGAAASAIPAGMATAGGMASGVGTAGAAGAAGASSALPGMLSSMGSGMMNGAMPVIGGQLASSLMPSKQNFPTPRPLGASFSMMPPQIPGAGVRPVPAIGSGGGDTSTDKLAMLLKVLQGGR